MAIKSVYVFPILQLLTCVGAAVFYACNGDWRRFAYWSAASVITASVTF